ncbi:trk system potassium uptake protein TrkH [Dethiosulfatibacter aminovorans DSM 17477]|uniref:Trk system potassium uptake protein TrkH n=1 Tax=Dethiosulfatibacter aminovorans DSM 17477 TaxID=1121476 RepID=A0A1M6DMG6_9FIRM|nr:TrkH family potassium uptake protein [Dethiosulfatibacter aminovorans]SHI74392.1 trk system potassium uptake protein TrkH [Dethiosulfatibacter aminovorans DSM 17477]
MENNENNGNNGNNYSNLKLHPSHFLILWFAILIFVGATLLNLPFASADGRSIGFIDALFTAASAVCVTGLVVVNTAAHWTIFGKLVILMLIQVGGLGIMTMATLIAFLLGKKITLKDRLLMQEEMNTSTIQGVVLLTRRILFLTIGVELIGAIFLSVAFVKDYGTARGIWFAIFHSVSAFCNAGFDITGNSLVDYVDSPIINLTVVGLVVIGGLGFYAIMDIVQKKKFKSYMLHTKLVLIISASLLVFGFVTIFAFEYNNPATMGNLGIKGKILSSLFHSMTPRTAGFNTLDTGAMTMPSTFLTILLMFVGGSPGSTAGGVKTTTVGIVVIAIFRLIKGNEDVEVLWKRIPIKLILRAIAVIGIAFMIIAISTLILLVSEKNLGASFMDMLFEVVSAFGTVGLSRGLTPQLSDIGRLVITLTMFVGRLGPLTLAFGIAQRQKENKGYYRYPEGKILVG